MRLDASNAGRLVRGCVAKALNWAPFVRDPTPEEFPGFPPSFGHQYYRSRWSDELIVALSTSMKPSRYVQDRRGRNVLYLFDKGMNYYSTDTDGAADAIVRLVERDRIRRTLFIGGSKAGFGALMLTGLCARSSPERQFRCLAFSPITRVYPENPRLLRYSSYRSLLKRASKQPDVSSGMQKFGDARLCQDLDNARIVIFYGDRHPKDCDEADHLSGSNIRKHPLPVSFHNTMTPLVIRNAPEGRREATLGALFDKMQKYEEARLSIPPTKELFKQEIDQMTWLPSLKQAIDDAMRD